MTGDLNPYQAPSDGVSPSEAQPGVARDAAGRLVLASLGARLAAVIIDSLFHHLISLTSGATIGLLLHGELLTYEGLLDRSPELYAPFVFGVALAVLAVQATLIAHRGQSIGKILLRTRIVRGDGRIPDLYHGLILRTLPVEGLSLLPELGYVLGSTQGWYGILWVTAPVVFLDAVLIFGAGRQCGHDRLAGTFVAKISAGSPSALPLMTSGRSGKRKAGRGPTRGARRHAAPDEAALSVGDALASGARFSPAKAFSTR